MRFVCLCTGFGSAGVAEPTAQGHGGDATRTQRGQEVLEKTEESHLG